MTSLAVARSKGQTPAPKCCACCSISIGSTSILPPPFDRVLVKWYARAPRFSRRIGQIENIALEELTDTFLKLLFTGGNPFRVLQSQHFDLLQY